MALIDFIPRSVSPSFAWGMTEIFEGGQAGQPLSPGVGYVEFDPQRLEPAQLNRGGEQLVLAGAHPPAGGVRPIVTSTTSRKKSCPSQRRGIPAATQGFVRASAGPSASYPVNCCPTYLAPKGRTFVIKATAAACSRDWLTHQPKPSPMKRMKPSIISIEPRRNRTRAGRTCSLSFGHSTVPHLAEIHRKAVYLTKDTAASRQTFM